MYLSHTNAGQGQRLGEGILCKGIVVAFLHMRHPRRSQTALLYHGESIRVLDLTFRELQRLPCVAPSDEVLSEAIGRGCIFLVRIERSLDVLEAGGVTGALCGAAISAVSTGAGTTAGSATGAGCSGAGAGDGLGSSIYTIVTVTANTRHPCP